VVTFAGNFTICSLAVKYIYVDPFSKTRKKSFKQKLVYDKPCVSRKIVYASNWKICMFQHCLCIAISKLSKKWGLGFVSCLCLSLEH
jgi:hypothetical protein